MNNEYSVHEQNITNDLAEIAKYAPIATQEEQLQLLVTQFLFQLYCADTRSHGRLFDVEFTRVHMTTICSYEEINLLNMTFLSNY